MFKLRLMSAVALALLAGGAQAQTGNSNAAYALVVIAQLLRQRGDPRAARAALEQAAAAGDDLASDILEDEPNWPQ